MSGPKRNPDRLNTIGIVVVGICGAVLVYVSIAALQAFYMNDTSEIQTMADYGGNDTVVKSMRSAQIHNITDVGSNPADPKRPTTYHIDVKDAMKLTLEAAKVDPANIVPAVGRSDTPTVQPIFGRPKPLATTPPAAPAGEGAGSGDGAGSAAPAPGAGAGSAATPTETKPAETKPAAKPAETKPAAKPAETKPAAKPAETKPTEKAAGSAAKGNGH